ncbi:carboxylate--amine ligase [Streptococcus pneumoniae]|nr:carboxylate--amine ligase [Streptococcus pneumoniae]
MHIVLFRYSPNVIKLECLVGKNALIIAPRRQIEKYESLLSDGKKINVIYLEDYSLPNLVLEIRRLAKTTKIDSITTLCEEDMDIAGLLHNHFVDKNSVLASNLFFKDKYYMRSFLIGLVEQPYFKLLEKPKDLDIFWKNCRSDSALVKPRNSAATIGIKRVFKNDILDDEYFNKQYIIEEYISLKNMLTCDGYSVLNGISRFYVHEYEQLLLETFTNSRYYLVRTSYLYNSNNSLLKKTFDACKIILNTFSVYHEITPFHFEWFYDSIDNRIIFCEVGKRFDGGNIPQLIFDSFNVDILEEYWSLICDKNSKKFKKNVIAIPNKISATYALYNKTGLVESIPNLEELDWADEVKIFIKPGERRVESQNVTENAMQVRFVSNNEKDYRKKLSRLRKISTEFVYKNE